MLDKLIKLHSLTCRHNYGWHRFNWEKTNLNLALSVPPQIHLHPSNHIEQNQGDDDDGGETITDHVEDQSAQGPGVEDDNQSPVEKEALDY